jgi:hypothetical protein
MVIHVEHLRIGAVAFHPTQHHDGDMQRPQWVGRVEQKDSRSVLARGSFSPRKGKNQIVSLHPTITDGILTKIPS